MSCQFFSLTGPPAQQGPPLNPEKEAETPGSLFEILTPGEFYEDVRSSFRRLSFSHERIQPPWHRPSKTSPLHRLEQVKGAERDNKVSLRSHSGTRGWLQP